MPRSSLFTPLRALTLTALALAISFVSGCSKRSPPDLSRSAGTNLPLLVLKGHTRDVNRIAFSPDGKHIATASLDHSVKLWNAGTGREMVTFTGHLNKVWPVAFSPDGTRVAFAGSDMAVRVWDANTARELVRFSFPPADLRAARISGVAFSPDGKRLATRGTDKTVRIWMVND